MGTVLQIVKRQGLFHYSNQLTSDEEVAENLLEFFGITLKFIKKKTVERLRVKSLVH